MDTGIEKTQYEEIFTIYEKSLMPCRQRELLNA